eukprot:10387949-Alexandrium_andersonii.AAC.1
MRLRSSPRGWAERSSPKPGIREQLKTPNRRARALRAPRSARRPEGAALRTAPRGLGADTG